MPNEQWDIRYLELARTVAGWSKDPSRKIGAVIIGANGQVLSQGYNGFPRKIEDTHERLINRPTKYKYVVHAEMNAIFNASYSGISLLASTLYVYGLPVCSECAKGVIQVGIRRVVIPKQEIPASWKESCSFTFELFKEAGVYVDAIEMPGISGGYESGPDVWEPIKSHITPTQPRLDAQTSDRPVLVHERMAGSFTSTPEI